jgi:hypothetical protein
MPVTINGVLQAPRVEKVPGRPRYNAAVRKLVPLIAEARKNGHYGISAIAKYLNDQGVHAPSGGSFCYTTMQGILHRLERLGIADGPRSLSEVTSGPRMGGPKRRSTASR